MRRFVYPLVCCAFVLILHLASFLPTMAAATINVPAQQATIQDGINAAATGDTVLVAPGTYYENINFNGKAVTVTSSGGPAVTIIDGSKSSTSTVTFSTDETLKSIISGFTIRNGYSQDIYVSSASPTIKGNVILGNLQSGYGNGIYTISGSPSIQGNLIANNQTGIYARSNDSVHVLGNIIAGNQQTGALLYFSSKADLVQQNTIVDNSDGGITVDYPVSSTTLIQNLITGNAGAGVNFYLSYETGSLTLVSNTIAGNIAQCCGAASASEIVSYPIDGATLENNLVVSTSDSPAFDCTSTDGPATFSNNDVYSSGGSAYTAECPVETGTQGNLSADPLFTDTLSDNFHIQSTSPAIKAGTITAGNEPKVDFDGDPRIVDGNIDIGADEYSSATAQAVSSYALHFGEQDVSTSSAPQSVTVTNNTKAAITIDLIATGSNFSQTNNCGAHLSTGANCEINVIFSPLIGGSVDGVLGIFTSATLNPEAVTLVGTGLAPVLTVGCCFNFYGEVIYTTTTQTETLTNSGQAPLLVSRIAYSGPSDFVQSNNCPIAPNSLAINASCAITVSYTPTIVGPESGTITITSNAGSPQIINFSGSSYSAGNPVLNPSTLTFPTTLIGQLSAPQTATLTNSGSGPMAVESIYAYSDFQETNNCPATLAVNAKCTITVRYAPSVQGTESGFISIYTDSASSPSLNLGGTGQAPVPTIKSLSISGAPADSSDIQAVVTGTGFVPGSQVMMDGIVLGGYPYISGSTQITFTVPITTAGTYQISVYTPTPGGGTSNSLPFTVYNPINYAEESTTYSYDTITGTNLGLYYIGSAQITSPFPIQFGGAALTTLTIGAGGTISFTGYASSSNTAIPYSPVSTIVAPFWANLYPFGPSTGTNNNVFYEVTGTAPNRALVVEWRNVGYCCESSNTVRFEVIFHEGSGNILFNYENTLFGGSYSADNNGATATDGIQVSSSLGTQFSYDQPLILSKTSQLWYPSSPTPSVSAHTLAFGYHQLDIPSTPQKVTLTNGSIATLDISSISTSNPDYTASSTCGATLASGASCAITVIFKPTQPSAEPATLTIADNATNSPQIVSLTGIGSITSTVVYPILVNFGTVAVGSSGTAPVTLANASNTRMTIQSITTSPSVYTESNNCGTSLAPGLSCTVTLTFKPTVAGSVQGTLSMGLESVASKVEATLTGSGK